MAVCGGNAGVVALPSVIAMGVLVPCAAAMGALVATVQTTATRGAVCGGNVGVATKHVNMCYCYGCACCNSARDGYL